ncbi:MAG: hypothetical protein KAJ40_01355 [Alphaproteobacteria bacterium]|nr:hypothetical protein [Alphaproteobacteria bacterium]
MGLNLKKNYYCFLSVLLLIKLRSYGRLVLLAGLTLAFSVSTASSYVMHDSMTAYSSANSVSRGTPSSFNEIIDMTEIVDTVGKAKVSAQFDKSSSYKSSSVAGNLCTSLLNTHSTSSSKIPAIRTQRPVGKVAALGLLLGARFALTPKQHHKRVHVNHSSDVSLECQNMVTADNILAHPRSAKDIVAYRQRMKEKALARLN